MLNTAHLTLSDTARGLEELQTQLTFRLSVLSKLLDRQMAEIAAEADLSLLGYRLLATARAFDGLSAADLGRYTGYDKAAISRLVTELEGQGLLCSAPDPTHGRRKILRLTDAGKARLDRVEPQVDARRDALSDQMTDAEEATFLKVIDKLAAHVDATLKTNGTGD